MNRAAIRVMAGFALAVVSVTLALAPAAFAARNWAVPGDAATIQEAIQGAASGDTIRVAPGMYAGPVDLGGKQLVLFSNVQGGATVDGGGSNEGFVIGGGQTAVTVISGFQITNATVGIHVSGASPNLIACTVSGCSAQGILCEQSAVTILNCAARSNQLAGIALRYSTSMCNVTGCTFKSNLGGGMDLVSNSAWLTECVVRGNQSATAGAGIRADACWLVIWTTAITGNRAIGTSGGGIYATGSTLMVTTDTISRNVADTGGGLDVAGSGSASLQSVIVWGNCATGDGDEVRVANTASCTMQYCEVNTGGISGIVTFGDCMTYDDPLFCDMRPCEEAPTTAGDFHTAEGSPAHSGAPCYNIGVYDTGCLETPVVPKTWGAIKQMFR